MLKHNILIYIEIYLQHIDILGRIEYNISV